MASHDLFLSCVSREFHSGDGGGFISYRDALASRLRNAGFHVEVQENFSEHGGDLLEKLEDYIKDCRVVIHLVGNMTGEVAKSDEAHAFLQRSPDFLLNRPALKSALGDCRDISYTQWEALFALHHNRTLLRYQADTNAPKSPKYEFNADQQLAQEKHWLRLNESGIYSAPFTSQENLCLQVFEALNRGRIFNELHPTSPVLIHNLPQVSLGNLFVGRENFLSKMRSALRNELSHTAAIIQNHQTSGAKPSAVHALGGVGKTRSAIEYAWKYCHEYDAILFISASSASILKDQIAALSRTLTPQRTGELGPDLDKQYAAALQWLQSHSRWFLILDNVDTPEAQQTVIKFIASIPLGDVCITTRIAIWPDSIQPLKLDVLNDDQGAAYLQMATQGQRASTPSDEADSHALSHRLEGLALALEHAAAYIKRLHLSYGSYIDKLNKHAPSLLRWHDSILVQYPKSVAETWQLTIEQLTTDEQNLLNTLSWFSSTPIPVWLISSTHAEGQKSDVQELLAGLSSWHLITWSEDNQFIKVHRLVQEVTRMHITDQDARSQFITNCFDWIKREELDSPDNPNSWILWQPIVEHVLCLVEHAKECQDWSNAVHGLSHMGIYCTWRGQRDSGLALQQQAFELARLHLSEQDTSQIATRVNLASALSDVGKHSEADKLYRETLKIAEHLYGANHPCVASITGNWGELFRIMGRHHEAEQLMRHAILIEEQSGNTHSGRFARLLSNLTLLLTSVGRFDEAESLGRKAIEISEKAYGPFHNEVAVRLNNVAEILRSSGRFREAEPLYNRALEIQEKMLGPDHPFVATSLNNIALLHTSTGHSEKAIPLFQRALSIYERTDGPDSPSTANALLNLAEATLSIGKAKEALSLSRRALLIDERFYGPHHHEVAHDLSNLANIHSSIGQLTEAENFLIKSLVINENAMGKSHPSTAEILIGIATVHYKQRRWKRALGEIERAITIFKDHGRQYGYTHPHLAMAQQRRILILQALPHRN
jgi:tetratricopeptide (TPR) repeat protein